jgi:hypothetical protein
MISCSIGPVSRRIRAHGEHAPQPARPALEALLSDFASPRARAPRIGRASPLFDPAVLALALIFAALTIAATLIAIAAPALPSGLPYFTT